MGMKDTRAKALFIPLAPQSAVANGPKSIQVIFETSKGSRNKYAFDPEQRIIAITPLFSGDAFRNTPFEQKSYARTAIWAILIDTKCD
jgi:hypothetical protein